MKLFLLCFLIIPCSFFCTLYAQKPSIPIDEESGKTLYTDVVQVDGVSSGELYERGLHWFNTYFKNPGSVLKEQNQENGLVTGQHGIYIYNEIDGRKNKEGLVKYYVKITVREGRYKYQIDDIFLLKAPKVYLEEWLDETAVNKDAQFGYVHQVDSHIKSLIEDMTKTLNQPIPTPKEDDW